MLDSQWVTSQWVTLQTQMQQQGQRRLVVLSGEPEWSESIVTHLKKQFQGDWLTISSYSPDAIQPAKAVSLLGREFLHGVFDATHGFNAEALAILAGTLKAGSWLVMRVPAWAQWSVQPDEDSLRWNESEGVIPTPNFIRHIQQQILTFPDVLLWRQGTLFQARSLPQTESWQMPDGNPTAGQQAILDELLQAERGVWVVTASRGRGKSALAGMLVRYWQGKCWLCAPAKITTEVIRRYSGISESAEQGFSERETPFWAVDNLLKYCRQKKDGQKRKDDADWLLIDEAAAIPTPQLTELIRYFPRILLTSTVQGYEGTGRGFLLKLCAALPECHIRELKTPMRWAENDPLEIWLDSALLFDDKKLLDDKNLTAGKKQFDEQTVYYDSGKELTFHTISQSMWLQQPTLLRQFYGLLTSAHYRTSPLDLRRLLDGNGMTFLAAMAPFSVDKHHLIAALWMVNEGDLSPALAHEIWAGRRRPRGNLVAQSLAAHGGFPQAATLRSQRVSRIAVQAQYRRRGIAQHLIIRQCQEASKYKLDFLSVSFGYTAELWALWQKCGFRLVRMGTHREASSGCYTAMAILPLSEQGESFTQSAKQQLSRDARELGSLLGFALPIAYNDDEWLNGCDWQELAGFAFAHRPLSASYFALQRLLLTSNLTLPALRKHLQQQIDIEQCSRDLSLSGRKALLKRWREETAQALASMDEMLANQWKNWVISCDSVEANRPHHPIYR
ncbi:tRNA(Met) cytidine acetyltransferase [Xenorhabdus sp. Reich]|uniref:tRNA(Met) cytidine acetyltransferase TmcA n=1 Tax=Xenorhabdus littoralis TaxID=2582835 RepID=A0ABU4SN38_9GAMM|nr:GNAT family N-acetyltransferase [Xenorhabdus sp. Reich]MDX8000059.1 tRNA(Met) cytidine acetyltransferase [Xenorhabdus sp. Reich]